jgi:hypothetical protein
MGKGYSPEQIVRKLWDAEAERLWELKKENARLKKLVASRHWTSKGS